MRVGLLASEVSQANGWANYSLNLHQQFKARGIATTVICARNSAKTESGIHPILPAVTPPERHSFLKSLRQWRRARWLLRDCDIIHSTIEPYAILAAALASDRPLFVTAHGSYVNLPRLRPFPLGQMYRRAFLRAQLICVSRHTASVARELLPGASVHVINNGLDFQRFARAPSFSVDKTQPTVVTVGEIKPRKGTLELVEAMAQVRQRIPEAQCLIMGNPQTGSAYTAKVKRRIDELGLRDNVRIMGFVEDELLRAWLAAADVFALPAMNDGLHFEGFGLAILEASAAGTAVVSTDNSGTADAIQHGVTGLIISQANISEALPRALLDLLENPAKRERMAAAGRDYARTQTWGAAADQVIKRYEQALA